MATVVLLGTLDTKGAEYGYLRDRLREQGVDVLVVDAGIFEPQIDADIAHDEVAAAAGADLAALVAAADRGAAVEAMCLGAAAVVRRLHADGRLDGCSPSAVPAILDRCGGCAGPAGRRAQADRLHRRLRRTRPLRRRERRHADVLGRRHGRPQPALGADPDQRGRRRRRHGEADRPGEPRDERPLLGGDDVRRHHALRDQARASAGGARLRGARLPRHRHRRADDGGADRAAASSPACST